MITSYTGAYIMIITGLVNEKMDVFSLGNLLSPTLSIVFGICILGFIIICSTQSKKSNNLISNKKIGKCLLIR